MWAVKPEPLTLARWWWEQDSNLRTPSGDRFYRPAPLTTRPSHPEYWSRRQESNPQPAVYKTAALPLSYVGPNRRHSRSEPVLGKVESTRIQRSGAPNHDTKRPVGRQRRDLQKNVLRSTGACPVCLETPLAGG